MLSLLSFQPPPGNNSTVADLIVRNVDPSLVRALKTRAGRRGVSAEAEHRAILAQALGSRPRRPLAEVLALIPQVGEDSDFARVDDVRDRRIAPSASARTRRRVSR